MRSPSAAGVPGDRIVELSADGIALFSTDGGLLWHNPAFAACSATAPHEGTGFDLLLPLPDDHRPPGFPDPTLAPAEPFRDRYGPVRGRYYDLTMQRLDEMGSVRWLCIVRDVTAEVGQREKLLAIQRAGRELSRLTPAELARMSTAERTDLLKANIIQYSSSILNFRNLEIRLLEPETGELKVLLSEGIEGGAHRGLKASVEGNGITGYVAATGASYLVGDVSTDPHYLPGAANARSSLTVPIVEKKQVIGTFNVESDKPDHYTSADREFLEVFAGEIAQAIGQLELLQAESQRGRAATAREVLAVAVVPADEIFAEASGLAEAIPSEAAEARETARKVLSQARILKNALRRVGANLASGERAPTTSLAGKRVLFADVDPELRTTAHQLLGVLGCDVETVGEAAEAIALARSEGYDVLVADINLPDLDGYELFMKIKSESPRTATVLMTGFGYDKGHILVRATQAGLKAKLFKPFRVDRLAEAIEDALEIKREQPSMLLGAERREII